MTQEQLDYKARVHQAKNLMDDACKKYNRLVRDCNHSFVKRNKSSLSAVCEICGIYGGWYCPESPNHICNYEHYDEEMGGHYVDEDDCIYCHEPEERK